MREEAKFLRELSECKRIVDITDYYEKGEHSLMVLEYLEVEISSKHSKVTPPQYCLQMGDLFSKISSTAYTLTEEKCKNFVTEMVKVSI